eukprot:4406333-Pyramimonas_sp.AAC.1
MAAVAELLPPAPSSKIIFPRLRQARGLVLVPIPRPPTEEVNTDAADRRREPSSPLLDYTWNSGQSARLDRS